MSEENYTEPLELRRDGSRWQEVVLALLHRKWMILGFGFLGVMAALMLKVSERPTYQSEAALWVLYVVDTQTMDPTAGTGRRSVPDARGETLINNETVVLKSYELARMAASSLLESGLLTLEEPDVAALARRIQRGLTVSVPRGSSTLTLAYRDGDPQMPQLVLHEVLTNYMVQHYAKHRAVEAVRRLEERVQLTTYELELESLKLSEFQRETGVRDVDQRHLALQDRMARLQDELIQIDSQMAAYQARIDRAGIQIGPAQAEIDQSQRVLNPAVVDAYERVREDLRTAQRVRSELLLQFAPTHAMVRAQDAAIEQLLEARLQLEQEHPALVPLTAASSLNPVDRGAVGFEVEAARRELVALEARKQVLERQLEVTRVESEDLMSSEGRIRDQTRVVANLEANLARERETLSRARTTGLYSPETMPNISVVEQPTPARPASSMVQVKMALSVLAALGLGIGLALLIELVLDQVVRRPVEVERRLNIPLMISIPRLKGVERFAMALPAPLRALPAPAPKKDPRVMILPSLMTHAEAPSEAEIAPGERHDKEIRTPARVPWDLDHAMRPYFEALRDRLMLFFQLQNGNHKPKLVAVTGCAEGSGTTTIAAGLASALSEVGEGNVLLVDLNFGRGAVHPFFRGRPGRSLDKALDSDARSEAQVQERLFLATGESGEGEQPAPLPKRLSSLMPKMRASDYDYIVFDMPPISETSATVALSASMDKTLLVIEAEKTHRAEAVQAFEKLREYKADVMGVFNKHQAQEPRWLAPGI